MSGSLPPHSVPHALPLSQSGSPTGTNYYVHFSDREATDDVLGGLAHGEGRVTDDGAECCQIRREGYAIPRIMRALGETSFQRATEMCHCLISRLGRFRFVEMSFRTCKVKFYLAHLPLLFTYQNAAMLTNFPP